MERDVKLQEPIQEKVVEAVVAKDATTQTPPRKRRRSGGKGSRMRRLIAFQLSLSKKHGLPPSRLISLKGPEARSSKEESNCGQGDCAGPILLKEEKVEVVVKEVMEEGVEDSCTAQRSLQQLLKLSGNAKALESLLPLSTGKALESLLPSNGKTLESLLPSLDMTALNLLCLARLQETAAALLPGRSSSRPLPAHLPSSMWGTSHPSIVSSSCHLQRRTHRCEQPGCDKVGLTVIVSISPDAGLLAFGSRPID